MSTTEAILFKEENYHLVCFERDGKEREAQPRVSDTLKDKLKSNSFTDVFIWSHGYNTDEGDVEDTYRKWRDAMNIPAELDAANEARESQMGKPFKALLVGIHWPSKLWTARLGGATRHSGESASADAGASELAELLSSMDEEDAKAVRASPTLKSALRNFVNAAVQEPAEVAALANASARFATADAGADAGDGAADTDTLRNSLEEAYEELSKQLRAVDEAAAGGNSNYAVQTKYFSSKDAFTQAAQDPILQAADATQTPAAAAETCATAPMAVPSGLWAATTAAAFAFVGRVAIYAVFGRFQRRAQVVGHVGVHDLLVKLMNATRAKDEPAPKFHLAGHSLGTQVVSSALVGPARDKPSLPAKVHSVALVQGAVSAGAYGEGEEYGSILGRNGLVLGPVVATYSSNDITLWFYGRMYNGEPLGRVGAGHEQPERPRNQVVLEVDQDYDLGDEPGTMINVDASGAVRDHNDVTDRRMMHLIWAAALAGGGGAGAEGAITP